uniref:STAS domain-containing protein n=1 Tax=Caenorhabditis japonica TaxID=281687 RepID=A0A8R1E3X1_CAEJA
MIFSLGKGKTIKSEEDLRKHLARTSPALLEDGNDTRVVFFASSLFYFNCERFEKKIQKIVDKFEDEKVLVKDSSHEQTPMVIEEKENEKTLIFDMQGVSNVDLSGACALVKIQQDLKSKNILFIIKNPNENVSSFISGVPNGDNLLRVEV